MAENTMDRETTHLEANALTSIAKPLVENSSRKFTKQDPSLKNELEDLGDTAYLEMGSQYLDKLKTENPEFYDAIMTREKALAEIAEAICPNEIKDTINKDPDGEKNNAYMIARHNAGIILKTVTQEALDLRKQTKEGNDARNFDAASRAIMQELETAHVINYTNARAIGSLMTGVLASLTVADTHKNTFMTIEISTPLEKQRLFDAAKERTKVKK